MPFLTFKKGSNESAVFPTNPFNEIGECRAHVILNHPSEANGLILARGENAYSRGETGYLNSEGRTITGSLKFTGSSVEKHESTCNFIVDLEMANHFRRLLLLRQSLTPVTVVDNWAHGRSQTFLAALSIGDARWETPHPGRLFLLQFSLLEI